MSRIDLKQIQSGSASDGQIVQFNAASGSFIPIDQRTLRNLIQVSQDGPMSGFGTNLYSETLPINSVFPTSSVWYTNPTKTQKIFEIGVTYNTDKSYNTIQYKVYQQDGVSLVTGETMLETYNYSGGNFLTPHISRSFS